MNADVVVIGIGNPYRRDDGVGPAVAAAIDEHKPAHVRVVTGIEDPMTLLEAWSGAKLAVLVDAAMTTPSTPGRIHRVTAGDLIAGGGVSTHGLNVTQALALGQALGRMPDRLVVLGVEAADTGQGFGFTAQVAAAMPHVIAAVAEIIGISMELLLGPTENQLN
ncbi:hydrogenase maturation protease [Mycobacterium noviomagense]|uniref:Peptidase M52 n=1 Tax=Mycobacterium noviomagense TaxID=459858 RepID=A0A7I7PI41_9MYCO|nr:hydrogenase maturation protease [Mycobacterium noviomagense]BBY08231.1 peptidase M52 [Mycobacterium noviomagense]